MTDLQGTVANMDMRTPVVMYYLHHGEEHGSLSVSIIREPLSINLFQIFEDIRVHFST